MYLELPFLRPLIFSSELSVTYVSVEYNIEMQGDGQS